MRRRLDMNSAADNQATSNAAPDKPDDSQIVTSSDVRDHMYANDHATRWLGIEITEIGNGTATAIMSVKPHMVNGHGVCHGGFIFTLADSAFGYACNSNNAESLAASASIDFLTPAQLGEDLIATAIEHWTGGRTGLTDVEVHAKSETQETRLIAVFHGRSARRGHPVIKASQT
jgi:acyl-CoA thioesterase